MEKPGITIPELLTGLLIVGITATLLFCAVWYFRIIPENKTKMYACIWAIIVHLNCCLTIYKYRNDIQW